MPIHRCFLQRLAFIAAVSGGIGLGSSFFIENQAQAAVGKAASNDIGIELPISEFTLANGLRVYVVEDHSTPAFNISLIYDVGSRDEAKGRTGFAHFFEHMMFQGSSKMGPMDIMNYTTRVGGNANASTSYDLTFYYHNLPSNYLDMILWGESDRLSSLEINDKTFETQRQAVISEKNMRIDNQPYAHAIFFDMFSEVLKGTPYEHPVIGSLEDLNAAKTSDVQGFFKKYYTPNNCVMVLVGDVDLAEVKTKVTKYFGDIAKGQPKVPVVKGTQRRGQKIEKQVIDKLAQQPLYVVGWPTVGDDDPDRAALDLLGNILLSGDSARLTRILTDEKKLTAGMGGGHQTFRDAGFMFIQATPSPKDDLAQVKDVIRAEVAKIRKKGVKSKELDKAMNQQIMQSISALSTNSGRAMAIATGALFYNDPKRVLSDLDRYRKVTAADIKRVANKYLDDNWIFYDIRNQKNVGQGGNPGSKAASNQGTGK